jgi:raffinose/stachyose/melibiose transport system permease protein
MLKWVGLKNYVTLMHDKIFWLSFKNNIYIIVASIVLQIIPGFILMIFLSSKLAFKSNFLKSVFFFPCVVSPIVIAYVWQIMYNVNTGLINQLLKLFGLGFLQQNWLSNPKIVMLSLNIPLAWQYVGYYMVIMLAGYTSVDKDVLESASIDGANAFQRAVYIILPLMKNTMNVILLLCLTGGIKVFDQVYALTGGGPGYSTEVLSMYNYTMSFSNNNYGYGSAIAITTLVISLLIIMVFSVFRGGVKQDAQ